MKYSLVILFLLIFCSGCTSKTDAIDVDLLTFPGISWDCSAEDLERIYPDGEWLYTNIYQIHSFSLMEADAEVTFRFEERHLIQIRADFRTDNDHKREILKRVKNTYGNCWHPYERANQWASQELVPDRLDDESLEALRERWNDNGWLIETNYLYMDSLLRRLYNTPLVTLTWGHTTPSLTWWATSYHEAHVFSEEKNGGILALETILKPIEDQIPVDNDSVKEFRLKLTPAEFRSLQKQWGASSERFFSYNMPSDALFWVSEERVTEHIATKTQKDQYIRILEQEQPDEFNSMLYAEMMRTPLVLAYWDEAAEELVYDLTGLVNLAKLS